MGYLLNYTIVCSKVKGQVFYGETIEALEMIKDAIEGIFEVRNELKKFS